MSVIFLFIDGIGLGEAGDQNPLLNLKWDSFLELTNGYGLGRDAPPLILDELLFMAVDANLGIKGLPQSGTGQATLFSGENASKIAGRHYGPFPHSTTRYLLEEKSLFHQAREAGFSTHFINAYPDIFFKKMNESNRWTCTTLMAKSVGQKLNGEQQLRKGKSITAEIVQNAWREQLNIDVKKITPEEAADRLIRSLEEYDLVMFEYYLTDKAGHSMNRSLSLDILETLNRFIGHILRNKRRSDHLVISSDHGNLENLAVKTHTRNPVPLIIQGKRPESIDKALSIMDVPGIITSLLGSGQ